jgi:hypothetical protein
MGNYYTSTGGEPVATRIGRVVAGVALLIFYVQVVSLAVAIPAGGLGGLPLGRAGPTS